MKKSILMSSLILILIVLAVAYFIKRSYFDSPFITTVIAENVAVSSEWIQIDIRDPIKIKGDRQYVMVNVSKPFEGDFFAKGIRNANGDLFNVEVKLVDDQGKEYLLTYDGFLGKTNITYNAKTGLPSDRTYVKVLLRSDTPIDIQRLLWMYYYSGDLR